ncbi:hypothetical protein ATK36_4492 [Amycolatopsis sulphurea]|uniref:Uncharacterized protein n=1 Tax=Amycolatopsis sulphurea TaxID=76022 RepID=A0A2A9FFK3_9PSEU|nr:hypothetical protein [Amycolatopsis sulphurea]PFG49342.1 hypothetical protein ATK36_4492 [Amycolatopsis sulphurea]
MNPLLLDWLTIFLAPIALLLFLPASIKTGAARKAGDEPSAWTAGAQAVGIVFVLIVALTQLLK